MRKPTTKPVATPVKKAVAKKPVTTRRTAPRPRATKDRFHEALDKVLVHEGGYVNHPKDPGGATNRGVTQRVYNAWRGKSNLPIRSVREISDNEVEAIYRFQYWEPSGANQMDFGVGYVVFDGAVNSGPKQSIKWLQRALGDIYSGKIDGVWGNLTANAIKIENDADALIARIIERRRIFLKSLKTWPTFGKGWTRRISDVLRVGQAWAEGSAAPDIQYVPDIGMEQKASIEDAKSAVPTAPGDVGAGTGIGTSVGAGGILTTVQEQLEPYSMFDWVGTVLVAIIIIGGLIAIGSFLWRMYAKGKNVELADALDSPVGVNPEAAA